MDAVVFEGCACRAAFHAGVATALAEAGLQPKLCAGASSGTLSATALAAGLAHELPQRWRALAGRSVVSWRRALHNRSPFDMSHLVRQALSEAFGTIRLKHSPSELLVTATRARDLRTLVFSSRDEDEMLEPIMASCFFPLLYGRTVRIRGELMLDGGLTDNLPVETVVHRGARELLAVVLSPDGMAVKNLFQQRWEPKGQVRGAKLWVLHPKRLLQLRSWELHPEKMEEALEHGYECARAFLGSSR